MANFVKPKAGLSFLSLCILILIPLLESSFNAPVTIKRWTKLDWKDFQGIPNWLSRFEAAISSAVYLEYDSTTQRFRAYAGQNNIKSWAKRSRPEQPYALNHEQYHFNITELHARKLNDYIAENGEGSEYLYNLRLGSINIDLEEMQHKYDLESNHGLNVDRQRRWEYEIDSLLVLGSGWVTESLSGAKIFFSSAPQLATGALENGTTYRGYSLTKYDMTLVVFAFLNEDARPELMKGNWAAIYSKHALKVKSVTTDTLEYPFRSVVIAEDTSNYTHYSLWAFDNRFVYEVQARFPNNTRDTTGYWKITQSFINSFSIANTDHDSGQSEEDNYLPVSQPATRGKK